MKKCFFSLVFVLLVVACDNNKPVKVENGEQKMGNVQIPTFNADSAYAFVKAQTDFGPRVPNTDAHEQCAA